jgi:hypothetical protein
MPHRLRQLKKEANSSQQHNQPIFASSTTKSSITNQPSQWGVSQ